MNSTRFRLTMLSAAGLRANSARMRDDPSADVASFARKTGSRSGGHAGGPWLPTQKHFKIC